uniref:RRM domain-containing protein n=1 Tax=Jaculus jaculus TaxID=51337 RepID=A0A8C5LJY0_JACJA
MDERPDLDLVLPIDPDVDFDKSVIYVQGLNDNVTLDDLADFSKQHSVVKMKKRTGQPMIYIYLGKETGKPKGDANVSYEDPPTAKAAVEGFDGKEFQGSKLKVSLAWKKPPVNSMLGGIPPSEGRGMLPPLHGSPGGLGGPGHGGDRGGNPCGGGNVQHQAGDWQCPNFARRTERNPGGMQGGRGGLMDRGGPGGMFRGGRGGDRGDFQGGRGGFGGGRRGGPEGLLGGGRGRHGDPGKMDKEEHRQECRDQPY